MTFLENFQFPSLKNNNDKPSLITAFKFLILTCAMNNVLCGVHNWCFATEIWIHVYDTVFVFSDHVAVARDVSLRGLLELRTSLAEAISENMPRPSSETRLPQMLRELPILRVRVRVRRSEKGLHIINKCSKASCVCFYCDHF